MRQEVFNKLWAKVSANRDYQKWARKHDAFEQVSIINGWCQYENYDVSAYFDNALELVCVYCYILFVVGVEFLDGVYESAEEGDEDAIFLIETIKDLK